MKRTAILLGTDLSKFVVQKSVKIEYIKREMINDICKQIEAKTPTELRKYLKLKLVDYEDVPFLQGIAQQIIDEYNTLDYRKGTVEFLKGSIHHFKVKDIQEFLGLNEKRILATAKNDFHRLGEHLGMKITVIGRTLGLKFTVQVQTLWG